MSRVHNSFAVGQVSATVLAVTKGNSSNTSSLLLKKMTFDGFYVFLSKTCNYATHTIKVRCFMLKEYPYPEYEGRRSIGLRIFLTLITFSIYAPLLGV